VTGKYERYYKLDAELTAMINEINGVVASPPEGGAKKKRSAEIFDSLLGHTDATPVKKRTVPSSAFISGSSVSGSSVPADDNNTSMSVNNRRTTYSSMASVTGESVHSSLSESSQE
jgi:hypothetical protein